MLASLALAGSPVAASTSVTSVASWHQLMMDSSSRLPGCFHATFPSLVWQVGKCSTPTGIIPANIGAQYGDESASTTGTIGDSSGTFPSETGFTSEKDSALGSDYFSLQADSNIFSTTCGSFFNCTGQPVTGWEQFVAQSGKFGKVRVVIEYWLVNFTAPGSGNEYCPSGDIPGGGSAWQPAGYSCTAFSAAYSPEPTAQSPAYLNDMGLGGSANLQSSGYDGVVYCFTTSCYEVNVNDTVIYLYKHWQFSEFNVLGFGGGSEAIFNSGFSLTVKNQLYNSNNGPITTSCDHIVPSTTEETNNLNLGTCTATNSKTGTYVTFSESD